MPGIAKEGYVKLNSGQHIPCRVAYDTATFERLKLAIRDGKLGTKDRVGLVSDLFQLGKLGKKDVGECFACMLRWLWCNRGSATCARSNPRPWTRR